jgi:hypothetical protein
MESTTRCLGWTNLAVAAETSVQQAAPEAKDPERSQPPPMGAPWNQRPGVLDGRIGLSLQDKGRKIGVS